MKKEVKIYEEILSESTLLDSELDALRGGIGRGTIKCTEGVITECTSGVYELTDDNGK